VNPIYYFDNPWLYCGTRQSLARDLSNLIRQFAKNSDIVC